MVLLEMGKTSAALAAFKRILNSSNIPQKTRPIALSALALAQLRQQQYQAAWESLEMMTTQGPVVTVLRLHAAIGAANDAQMGAVNTTLKNQSSPLPQAALRALNAIQQGFCITGTSSRCRPDKQQRVAITHHEVDMLLAA
jgi:hypothetical protein